MMTLNCQINWRYELLTRKVLVCLKVLLHRSKVKHAINHYRYDLNGLESGKRDLENQDRVGNKQHDHGTIF